MTPPRNYPGMTRREISAAINVIDGYRSVPGGGHLASLLDAVVKAVGMSDSCLTYGEGASFDEKYRENLIHNFTRCGMSREAASAIVSDAYNGQAELLRRSTITIRDDGYRSVKYPDEIGNTEEQNNGIGH